MAHPKISTVILIYATFFAHNFHFSDAIIDPALLEILGEFGKTDVLVQFFGENSPVIEDIESRSFESHEEKITTLTADLKSLMDKTQSPISSVLELFSVESESFWGSNQMVIMDVPLSVLELVDAFPQVMLIQKLPVMQLFSPITEEEVDEEAEEEPTMINVIPESWGVDRVEAKKVRGVTEGEGVIVASIDTGVRVTHEALKGNWLQGRWFDPYPNPSNKPTDNNGHGTHTMGTIAGQGGIGVASRSKWISCRGCGSKSCGFKELVKCGQWMLHNPKAVPDIINNSWGGPNLPLSNFFNGMVKMWRAAGIIPVFAMGNSGPLCTVSLGYPGALPTVLGVGATDKSNHLAFYSGRGPVVLSNGKILFRKPDLAAPGTDITSAWFTSDNAYKSIKGTSMAAPHVTGVLALMLSARRKETKNPHFRFDFEHLKHSLSNLVDTKLFKPIISCSPEKVPYSYPNNDFGHGMINALKAVVAAKGIRPAKPTTATSDSESTGISLLNINLLG